MNWSNDMKKIVALLLLFCIVLMAFVSCKDNGSTKQPPKPPREDETGEDVVPLPEADYSNLTYNIISRETYSYEWDYVEEDAGAVINDAIFERNTAVESRYGIVLTTTYVSNASFDNNFINPINNAILAGDDTYQLVAGYQYRLAPAATTGNFLNWYDVPNIDLEREWWNGDFVDAAAYNDHAYVLTGSLSLSHLYSSSCFFFNQDLLNARFQNGSEEIFDHVEAGTWTIDTFYEYAKECSTENGDEVWDSEDLYGFATNTTTAIDGFLFAFDIPVTQKNDKGTPVLAGVDEKLVNATIKINDIINVGGHTFDQSADGLDMDSFIGMFVMSKAVFSTGRLADAQTLRSSELNYGILPYPKWDSEQEGYHSYTLDYSTVFAIPRIVENAEMVGTVTEALAYYSYQYVRDALYNTVLKYRDAKDENSSKCVDIILNGARYDFANIYAYAWGDVQGPASLLRVCINQKMTYIKSGFKSNETRYNTVLTEFLKAFKDE